MYFTENSTLDFFIIILGPLCGLIINLLFFKKDPVTGARVASCGVWIGFMSSFFAWFTHTPYNNKLESWGFLANETAWVMATLILLVSAVVHHFSLRYMAGDRHYRRYFILLNLITLTVLLMVAADHILILISFWLLSNLLLVLLMIHKVQWEAARQSGLLALKTFLLGFLFLCVGLELLAYGTQTLSLQGISENSENLSSPFRVFALLCIMIAALTQSGVWPFHAWVISSLNSPTPVSAFMHAGLVNGGGLLLVRLANIFLLESALMDILFVIALITLFLGGIWKLLQSDIKRMLACSTMTQMGFMMMQCALGLFPAALTHLCWHGLFKAYLFLRSGSTLVEHRASDEEKLSSVSTFFIASLCGLIGAIGFMIGGHFSLNLVDTTLVLIFFSWIAFTQVAQTLLEKKSSLLIFFTTTLVCFTFGIIYGLTIYMIENVLAPLHISEPQSLHFIHLVGVSLVFIIWILLNLKPLQVSRDSMWWRRFYVHMLNASQPDVRTLTSRRDGYKF
ncbi:MAG: hypothetical protein BGO14_01440 [Chlamydiales bacterium 38-26]|nr:hypothetical protein [Chlamydiales bacterium]OJV08111.1 MAG: hypothetical protein BGO14_01440 [Chlamydiales bacterium 38-26]